MDNFLTRLVKRTLGLIPVVQPMTVSMFAPGEIALDSYSSGFEIENSMAEASSSGETMSIFSSGLPVHLSSSLSEETSNLPKTKIYSLSTFEQLVESGNNEPIVDSSIIEISKSDREQATVTRIDKQENYTHLQPELNVIPERKTVDIATLLLPFSILSQGGISPSFGSELLLLPTAIGEERQGAKATNFSINKFNISAAPYINKYIYVFSQNYNSVPSFNQSNTFKIIIPTYYEKLIQIQNFPKTLEQVEPLVKLQIETEQLASLFLPLSQGALSYPVIHNPLSPQMVIDEENHAGKVNNLGAAGLFEIALIANINKNISKFFRNFNIRLPNEQLNAFNIVPLTYPEEVTPIQKASKESLERVETLVEQQIETKQRTSSLHSLSQETLSYLILPELLWQQNSEAEEKQTENMNYYGADEFSITFISGFNRNTYTSFQNPNLLADKQSNLFNIISPIYSKELTPSQNPSERILTRIEPLVKRRIEPEQQTYSFPPLYQGALSHPFVVESLSPHRGREKEIQTEEVNYPAINKFKIALPSNINKNLAEFLQNLNLTLSDKQLNTFSIVILNTSNESILSEKTFKASLELVEPLVKQRIKTKQQISSSTLLFQGVLSYPIMPQSLWQQRAKGVEEHNEKANIFGANRFEVAFKANITKNTSMFLQNLNSALLNKQPKVFNIVPPICFEEVKPTQKTVKESLELVEPLVKQKIKPEQQTSSFPSLYQKALYYPVIPESLWYQSEGTEDQTEKVNNSHIDRFEIEIKSKLNNNKFFFLQHPKSALFPEKTNTFNVFHSNYSKRKIHQLSQKSNITLPNEQLNAFNIVLLTYPYPEEVTIIQKASKERLERIEPLVKWQIDIEQRRASLHSLFPGTLLDPIVPKLILPQIGISEEIQTEKVNHFGADGFEIALKPNINKNISRIYQNYNTVSSSRQPNILNIVSPTYLEEITPSQKLSERTLERIEPLIKWQRETERQIETQSSNVQAARVQLKTKLQEKDPSTTIYTNGIYRGENKLGRIKSLVHWIFPTQYQRDSTLSLQQERVELSANLLASNLNPQSALKDTSTQIISVQPTASEMIQPHTNIENYIFSTEILQISDPIKLPKGFLITVSQSNSHLSKEFKIENSVNSKLIKLPLISFNTKGKNQNYKNFNYNTIKIITNNLISNKVIPAAVQPTSQMTDFNQIQNYPNANNLSTGEQETLVATSTSSNSQQLQTSAELQSRNCSILSQKLIQLVLRQSTNTNFIEAEPIHLKQNNQTHFLSTSQLKQPFTVASKQLHLVQLSEDVNPHQREFLISENKERPEIKAYASNIVNQIISQSIPILINSKRKVNQGSESKPQTDSALSISEAEWPYNRVFAFLTRQSLSVLSQPSSKQLGIDPIAKNLLEFQQLTSNNRREVANGNRTAWQNISATEMTIQITIGRIEVRANNPPTSSPPRKSTQREPKLSLEDYLKQRQGEK